VTSTAVSASFRCLACGAAASLSQLASSCASCGGLLEVHADLKAWGRSGAEWRDLFDRRRAALPSEATPPYQLSGVWRFRELVLPDLPEREIVSKGGLASTRGAPSASPSISRGSSSSTRGRTRPCRSRIAE